MLHVSFNISCDCCNLRVPFQLASPPGFQVTHVPKGNLVSGASTLFVRLVFIRQYPQFVTTNRYEVCTMKFFSGE